MSAQVDVLVQPVTLRFRLHGDEIVYLFAGGAEGQLDGMELGLGVDPERDGLFDANVGFLPVATTTLIRGERTIVVDPGNHHVGFYGMLAAALRRFDLTPADVDLVVCTHSHHDHMASLAAFPGVDVVLGEGELDYAREVYGAAATDALLAGAGAVTLVPAGGELDLGDGVLALATPGHTPGHVSLLVETGDDRVLVAGDVAMFRAEYEEGRLGHWYRGEQRDQLEASLARLRRHAPTLVLPGHDRAFRPGAAA